MTCVLTLAALAMSGCGESPPASDPAPKKLAEGVGLDAKSMYEAQCVSCHGATGAGDGSMAGMLPTKPRSFGAAEWRFVDFTAGDAAIRAEVTRVIREGIADVMMPGYVGEPTDAEMSALVEYVLELRRAERRE